MEESLVITRAATANTVTIRDKVMHSFAVAKVRWVMLSLVFLARSLNYLDPAPLGAMQPVLAKAMNWPLDERLPLTIGPISPERIANVAVLITVGAVLFFGARSVTRLVLWLRRCSGHPRPDRPRRGLPEPAGARHREHLLH